MLPPRAGARLPELGLEAEFPSPVDPPSGCAFHPRCPKADVLCAEVDPKPAGIDPVFRCHHPNNFGAAAHSARAAG